MTADELADLFATVDRPLSAADGIPEADILAAEQRLGVRLPDVLRTFYSLTGKHRLNGVYDRLSSLGSMRIDRRMLVFYAENQGVEVWGVRATKARRVNPSVYYSGLVGHGRRSEWREEDLRCSDFLTLMVCWQAAHGLRPCGWSQEPAAVGKAVAARFGTLRTRDLCGGYRPGQVVCVTGLGREMEVWAAGRTPAEFAALREELAGLGVTLEVS